MVIDNIYLSNVFNNFKTLCKNDSLRLVAVMGGRQFIIQDGDRKPFGTTARSLSEMIDTIEFAQSAIALREISEGK